MGLLDILIPKETIQELETLKKRCADLSSALSIEQAELTNAKAHIKAINTYNHTLELEFSPLLT